MPYILVRHKVQDYNKWHPIYSEHGAARKAGGSKGARLFRSANDPNELVILLEWDDLQKAQQFTGSQDLREAMERAGVADRPDIYFLEEIEQTSA
jgi:heme-degrading monooxygenase HmoA